jgi:hypothetical protein
MKPHGNARTCPQNRRLLVARVLRQGWSVVAAAERAGVSERTVSGGEAVACGRSRRACAWPFPGCALPVAAVRPPG